MAGPLGRLVQHDPKSRAYPFKAAAAVTLSTVRHNARIGILDQGDLGACTGFATIGALGCDPFYDTLLDHEDMPLDGDDAREVYSRATALDIWPGVWPPEDTGSSGLAAAKAAHEFGMISGYQHAFTVDDALAALQQRPVITGVNWYSSFDSPTFDGMVKIDPTAFVRGGHEVCADAYDAEHGQVWFRNSWGPRWGREGRFCMTVDTWARLLGEHGDVTVFVPITAPEPEPVIDPVDAALMAAMEPWRRTIVSRITKAGRANAAYGAWKQAKGYK